LNTDCVECWFNEDKPMDISRFYWDNEKTIPKYKFEQKDEPPKYERMKQYKCKESFILKYCGLKTTVYNNS